MMIPRQAPLAGATAAVFDKRKREGHGAEPAETIALAAGGRDLPARHCGARRGGGAYALVQDEAEPAAFAGRERKPPRRREVGFARKLGHDRARRAASERFLHRP